MSKALSRAALSSIISLRSGAGSVGSKRMNRWETKRACRPVPLTVRVPPLGYGASPRVHPKQGQSPRPVFVILFAEWWQDRIVEIESLMDFRCERSNWRVHDCIFEALPAMRQGIGCFALCVIDFILGLKA